MGTRQFKIRQMLFKSLGIPEQDEMFMSHSFLWRGSRRCCDVLFTNVRSLPDESLRSKDDWKLIIDFPFDSEGHSPTEDLDRVDNSVRRTKQQRTLVWLPSFFSTRTQSELGKLVIIDRLLLGNNLDQHAKHLSLEDRRRPGCCFRISRVRWLTGSCKPSKRLMRFVLNPRRAHSIRPTTCRSRTSSRCSRRSCCNGPSGQIWAKHWSTCSIRPCRISSRSIQSSARRSNPARI